MKKKKQDKNYMCVLYCGDMFVCACRHGMCRWKPNAQCRKITWKEAAAEKKKNIKKPKIKRNMEADDRNDRSAISLQFVSLSGMLTLNVFCMFCSFFFARMLLVHFNFAALHHFIGCGLLFNILFAFILLFYLFYFFKEQKNGLYISEIE